MPTLRKGLRHFYRNIGKPVADQLTAFLLLIVLMPFLLFIAVVLFLHLKANPIFRQKRIGYHARAFHLYKFRTMKVTNQWDTATSVTRFLRASSLDELPQLINIFLGHMSFVGPRPLLPEYLAYYEEGQNDRHLVKPGLTGLAQLKLGNSNKWRARLALDLSYVERQSFMLDLGLLFFTFIAVFRFGQKASQDHSVMRFDEYMKNQ